MYNMVVKGSALFYFFLNINFYLYILLRFRVDFFTASGQIALHINPRFDQNCIVRNTDRGGWGAEERSGGFPFRHNTPFEMVIIAESDHFKVSINGHHAFDYRHRIPLNEVTVLNVEGGIDCHHISYLGVRIISNLHFVSTLYFISFKI